MGHKYDTKRMEKHLAIYKIYELVVPKSGVIDVGCSTGFLGAALKKGKECSVTGVDNDRDALGIAQKKLDGVIFADIEKNDIRLKKRFDYIIFADVLEHTRNPEAVIKRFLPFLKQGGSVLVSLPNVAHPLNRINLLLGRWAYKETGILDRTHLRFFTYKSAMQMLENSGLKIAESKAAGKLPLRKTLAAQFVFRCEIR